MSRSNVARLISAFIPFCIMVFIQRALLLLFGYTALSDEIAELLAFVPAALVCALVFSFVRTKGDSDDEEIPPLQKRDASVAILVTAVAVSVMVAMMYAVNMLIDISATEEVALTPINVISLILIHPILEEYVFRGLIYKEMRRMNPVFATLACAVMFAIVHNTVGGMLYALVSGIVLSVLIELSGRLSAVIAAHIIINVRSLLYMTLLSDMDGAARTVDTAIFVIGGIALVGALVLVGRRAEPETEDDLVAEEDLETEEDLEAEDDA